MLLSDDAGATWSRLPSAVSDVIALATAPG
jgi:hypothetical protein